MRIVVVAALLVACGPPADPGLRARTQPVAAQGVEWSETHFTGAGGTELYAQRWQPSGPAKAVVLLHHGFADHSTRYEAFAQQLVRAGYTVWAFDMRGHGRSAGHRVTFERIDDLLDDLDACIRLVHARDPGPLFLYGHSVGGLVTSLFTIERQPALAGLVLAAPAIALEAPPIQIGAIRIFGAIARNLPGLDTPHRGFSRRDDVVAEMNADPLIYQAKGPIQTARSVTDGIARVWAAPERLAVPLLIVHGTEDPLTAPSGSRDLVAHASSRDKTLRLYDGLVHDLLREPDGGGAQVAGDVIAWLDAHTGGPAVTFTSSSPTGPLRGDQHGRAMSVELDARGEIARDDAAKAAHGATGGLRVRLGFGHYYAGLDLRGGVIGGDGGYEADGHLLGVSLRSESGALVALTGGVGIGGVRGAGAMHAPIELSVEAPAGPLRLLGRAGLAWRIRGDEYADDAHGIADEMTALAGFRIGRDRRYWAAVTGGGGPFLAVTYRNLGGVELVGLALGIDLWGGN